VIGVLRRRYSDAVHTKRSILNVISTTKPETLLALSVDPGKQLYSPCTVPRPPKDDGRYEKGQQRLGGHTTPRGRCVDNDKHHLPEQMEACQHTCVKLKYMMDVTCHAVFNASQVLAYTFDDVY
jgi:hypothetical protein